MYLGAYRRAADLLEMALQGDDAMVRSYAAEGFVTLGTVHDLLGERDQACRSYELALTKPDTWIHLSSAHGRARRYLRHPFSEEDVSRALRLPAAHGKRTKSP
jgi:hypothetical protein